jgi:leucine-zipper of insertion element IS481
LTPEFLPCEGDLTEQQIVRQARRRILSHAEEVTGNVAQTCRYYGISRQCFYTWLRRFEAEDFEGLRDRSSRPHFSPLATHTDVVGKIVYLRQHYHFGPRRISMYLARYHDISIRSASLDFLPDGRTAVRVEVEVLGVLVAAEVGEHPASSVLGLDVGSHGPHDVHHFSQQTVGCVAEIGERRYVALGHDDDVNRPKRAGVMKRQDVVGFEYDFDRRSTADCFIAIEVSIR